LTPFPTYRQSESKDCGPTCIKIISKHYGKTFNIQQLRELSETTREGSSLLGLSEAVEKVGFRSLGIRTSVAKLAEVPLPCILHWNKEHYVVLYKVPSQPSQREGVRKFLPFGKTEDGNYHISDPAHGLLKYSETELLKHWIGNNATTSTEEGVLLIVEPTPKFYNEKLTEEEEEKFGFKFISRYLFKYKRFIIQLAIGLLAGSLLQLITPFLTQSIVDVGIKNQDINFVYLILISQLMLFFGRTALDVIRGWITLHLSTRINISLISDFFIKLMNLPISYFDTKMTGDILQRIGDHKRIESLLTTSSLNTIFSFFNLIIFSFVLMYYSMSIFLIFIIGSFAYFAWVLFFFKKRKDLDYKRFSQVSQEQSKEIELINGMQEIKLHNAERRMRWSWEYTQARIFKISMQSLALEQTQTVGSQFINQFKNIIISVLSAKLVIEGDITLGMMMAISNIVGQLDAPVAQMIGFMRNFQDAKISIERLAEIHDKPDEEAANESKIHTIPEEDIKVKDISFRYTGALEPVIKNLSLTIPAKKITAIVGASGSGKTTLMKILLKFYELEYGEIHLGKHNINSIAQQAWRHHCGVVMQEGYIFNDTIAKNIAVGEDYVDTQKLEHAIEVANIQDYIQDLPQGYNTKIGMEGVGLSTGQKQRLFIARAVYKNPKILFFDEATSALDANNEKIIMENLNLFFKDKTVVVIAHRLSTVRNADQIVVLDKGKIAEIGNHQELVKLKGKYYELVKNQLELGG
jgi:ATP-binding cassette subfamily B protein